MLLVDTSVWLELLLDQEKAESVRKFFETQEACQLAITEFSLYSVGVIVMKPGKDEVFRDYLADTIKDSGVRVIRLDAPGLQDLLTVRKRFGLDFDDAYQYAAAEKHSLTLVNFDADFDHTERGRKTPAQVMTA